MNHSSLKKLSQKTTAILTISNILFVNLISTPTITHILISKYQNQTHSNDEIYISKLFNPSFLNEVGLSNATPKLTIIDGFLQSQTHSNQIVTPPSPTETPTPATIENPALDETTVLEPASTQTVYSTSVRDDQPSLPGVYLSPSPQDTLEQTQTPEDDLLTPTPTSASTENIDQQGSVTPTPTATETQSEPLTAVFISDEIVVKFDPRISDSLKTAYIKAMDTELSQEIDPLDITILKVPKGKVNQLSDKFNDLSVVEYAEPNYIATISDTLPNDPSLNNQYGLNRLQVPQAWDISTGSSAVIIAILDTGVDLDHPDLVDKIVPGYDFVNNDDVPDDDHFHGTHVAGIAAASTNNGIGIAGISWGARIMPVKVLDNNGAGSYATIIAGIVWAVDHGARVINLSLGGTSPSPSLEAAVDYAYEHNVVLIAAAGNNGDNTYNYPAAYTHVIAVTATDTANNRASFSNYGSWVDLAAPGVAIYSTMPGDYGILTGTSMASPFVSGAAAVLAGLPQFSNVDSILTALENTALDLGEVGLDPYYGYGLVQLPGALTFDPAQLTPPPTPTQTQTPATYIIQTSDDFPDGFPVSWITAANDTGLHGDDGYARINLPFGFNFNHQLRLQAFISTNGFLAFSSEGSASYNNVTIPESSDPNEYIAPYWDDLNPTSAGGIYYDIKGSSPNRSFFVEWRNVPLYTGSGTVSFELVLNEGSDDIYLLYGPSIGMDAQGDSATVGIEYANGTAGTLFSFNTANALHDGLMLRFSPNVTTFPTPIIDNSITLDDSDSHIQYSDNWLTYNNDGSYMGTLHHSGIPGSNANLIFNGERLSILFSRYPNRGLMQVEIDGVVAANIDQFGDTLQWQQKWDSEKFSPGTHTLKLTHISRVDQSIDLDALIICCSTNPIPTQYPTPTLLPTYTKTPTSTFVLTPTSTYTPSPSPTFTATPTNTQSPSPTPTFTTTYTITPSPSPTPTYTRTLPATNPPPSTLTLTPSRTPTHTSTLSPQPSKTQTPTKTFIASPTPGNGNERWRENYAQLFQRVYQQIKNYYFDLINFFRNR